MIFDANNELLRFKPPGEFESTLNEISTLGADTVRVLMYWHSIAPQPGSRRKPPGNSANPDFYGIRWGPYDSVVTQAKARGMDALLTIAGPFPKWASKSKRSTSNYPSPSEYFKLVSAIGKRYNGRTDLDGPGPAPPLPRVKLWAIWNEPNVKVFLGPQKVGGRFVGAEIYRRLLQAAKRALNATGHGSDTVLMGETSPRGSSRSIGPLTFARAVLCVKPRRRCPRLPADGYAQHPYSVGVAPFRNPKKKTDVNVGTVSRITRVLNQAARRGIVKRGLPIWLTEFGIQSRPDPFSGVPLVTQAAYRSIAEYIAWRDPRVRAFSQYLMRDDPPDNNSGVRYGGFESGIRFSPEAGGGQKPSYADFRTPLVIKRRGGRVLIWGHIRPGGGSAKVQTNDRGNVQDLRQVPTRGYFSFGSRYRNGRTWRIVWTDSHGRTFSGPFLSAYKFR
jgi:hypothetical protein